MKIGNLEIKNYAALAPMAGVADCAFRELCAKYGSAYTVTEMVSAKGIHYNSERSAELMELSEHERPAGVQIFGDDPAIMADAARFAMRYNPDFIDINMGCPAPKISGNGAGASLMKKPQLCGEIVRAVSEAVKIPVTVKMRKGWDDNSVNCVEVAKIVEANGAAAVVVHGRTRQQYYKPPVDRDIIAKVKKAVKIPVIGNGDVVSGKSAKLLYEHTGCDLIMVGRGAMGNPWIFSEINEYFKTGQVPPKPDCEEKLRVMRLQVERMCELKGEFLGMRQSRKHIVWYLKGFHGAASLRNEAGRVSTMQELDGLIDKVLNS
ncbi:MAG: tRNA dihydrouridine synthase DusB [Ruminococcus sp.]|nr:tRNA dihydrouridine synthase DusB [Ruminococcus sp.]